MLQLADRPGVDWKAVALAHDKWDYQQEGLTAEAALMIAIAVAIVSGGTGASLVGATSTMGIAVANAGFIALTSQAAITLINNKGNLGKTLSDLGREETLRSVATAMVTAGALSALAGSISVPSADGSFTPLANVSGSSDLVAQIGKNVINNAASAVIDTAINGGDLGDKLGRAITTGVIDAAGASAANSVGDLSGFSNRMGHLVVGCALGAAKGGDCGAGAIGGLAGELAAEWYGGNREPVSATQASKTVDVARLFGALAVTLVGGDAQVGATAAGNAAQNNFLNHFQVKQLNERLAQCKGQVGCINQAISEARELDKRQHDLIAQTETAQGSRALVEGIQRPGATIDTSLCAGVSACVKYAEELPLINVRDYNYGVQDRIGELAQIKRIRAFETQIRQADPALSDEEVTRRAAARAGVYDAGRLGQLLGTAGRGGAKGVVDGGLADSSAIRRAYLNNKFERSGDLNLDINFRGNQEIATNFFRSQSVPEGDIGSYMTGIDLYQAVSVQMFGPRKALWQYQTVGAPQGNWYSLSPLVQPTELGISPLGFNRATQTIEPKIIGEYVTTERVSMLRSTSASVSDFWSVKGQLYPTVGGAQQLFTTHKSSIILKKEP